MRFMALGWPAEAMGRFIQRSMVRNEYDSSPWIVYPGVLVLRLGLNEMLQSRDCFWVLAPCELDRGPETEGLGEWPHGCWQDDHDGGDVLCCRGRSCY